jgi:glucose-6-phosphate isomerase
MNEEYRLGDSRAAVQQAMALCSSRGYSARIWAKDASLWKREPEHERIIANALGWLTVADTMLERMFEIEQFSRDARSNGLQSVFLLGMGGSSLAPEVCAATFGMRPGHLALTVLDTTDPDAILAAERGADLARTLFLVSSKSGGTIESSSLEKYFYGRMAAAGRGSPGSSFAAITDPGTGLERLARERGYRRIFSNPADIGGRYSALSYFGVVPMALLGIDVGSVLWRASDMARRCGPDANGGSNPGLVLGAALGGLLHAGRDKLTFVLAPEIEALGYWLEQLIAESTGKEGIGIVPVEGETLGEPGVYGDDRVFVSVSVAGSKNAPPAERLQALSDAGHPVLSWEIADRLELGAEFYRWEFATAVAGAIAAIDPFDQPNVQESKDNTGRLIQAYRETGALAEGDPIWSGDGARVYAPRAVADRLATGSLARLFASYLELVRPRDYFGILAYLDRSDATAAALAGLRGALRDRLRIATTLGYGPRFLHSTGQLHKGGPDSGLFLQLTSDPREDLTIPGEPYTFATLRRAQALGDFQSLEAHGRRVLRLHVGGDPAPVLARLEEVVQSYQPGRS